MSTSVLIVGSGGLGTLENAYLRAFGSLEGVSVSLFNLGLPDTKSRLFRLAHRASGTRYTYRIRSIYSSRRLVKFLSHTGQRFDVILVFKGMELTLDTLFRCREAQSAALWVNINADDPFNITSIASSNTNVQRSLTFYDVYCIWSQRLVQRLRDVGCPRVLYLPFGYDSDYHLPPVNPPAIEHKSVSFVGTWDPQREAMLSALRDYDLRIYGDGWQKASHRSGLHRRIMGPSLYGEALARVIYAAEVSLNIMRPQNSGAHNMRTFEIPAIGGLMLTTRSEEQEILFPEGEACLMYADPDELRIKINGVVNDVNLALNIRRDGVQRLGGHSYRERARFLLNYLNGVRAERGGQERPSELGRTLREEPAQ